MSRAAHALKVLRVAANLLYRRIPYMLITTVCLYLIGWLGIRAFYRIAPASWFLHIQSAQVANAQVGQDLLLTLCRDTHYSDLDTVNTRSFYRLVNNNEHAAGQYDFSARIEHNKRCQTISIGADKHPEVAGVYLIHTDMTFKVHGFDKNVSYDTNEFLLSDTRQSLQEQIDQLQRQIDQLQARQSAVVPVRANLSKINPTTPSTSAAPSAPAASPPMQGQTGLLQSTLNYLGGATDGLLSMFK